MAPSTRSSRAVYGHFDPGPEPAFEEDSWDPDVEMTDVDEEEELSEDVMERDPVSNIKKKRLIIAIDFGTTFSSVAYVVLKRGVKLDCITVENVECIDYPNYIASTIHDKRYDVPTELWYDYGQLNSKERPAVNGTRIEDEESSSDDNDDKEQEEGDNDAYHEKVPSDDSNCRKKNTNSTFKNRKLKTATRYWGFGVRNYLDKRDIRNGEARKLKRFKLNLNPTEKTDHICTETKATLKILRKHGIISNDTDIYEHFLTHLLTHTKDKLEESKKLSQDMLIQFVICVPAKWPMNACRVMQMALAKAVKEAGFGEQAANEDVHNVFMITEPEAAAECILAEGRSTIIRGETVVIIDAGGGTVDAVTYKCTSAEPLRLEAEMEEPDSKLCGASFIDEKFEKKLIELLKNEAYLVTNGKTIESIAQNQTTIFENCEKRTIDVTKNAKLDKIRIEDLRPNKAKHFEENLLELKRKTVRSFFEGPLAGVEEVLERQLNRSEENGCVVRKVILTGGFGQSPSLKSRLGKYLEKRLETHKQKIELITPGHPATAVARGAVLRALNKNLGPSRITQSSYGFLVNEPYQPEVYEEHKRTICRIEHADGEKYVDGVIDWIIQVGDKVDNMQEFVFVRKNSFLLNKTKLTCSEQLWMSDNQHPPHYRNTHEKNKGAELVGKIDVDLTFLKDNNLIKPKTRLPSGPRVQTAPQKFWEVIYEVIMIVQGRSIHFEAKWPARANLRPGQRQEKLGAKFVSIAASFKPGTA